MEDLDPIATTTSTAGRKQVNEDDSTLYSLAHIVDTNDLASHATCSSRLVRACLDALDFKPMNAERAIRMLKYVREFESTSESDHMVLHWALVAAAHAVQMDIDNPSSTVGHTTAPPSPPEPLVRFICAETVHSSLDSGRSDSDIQPKNTRRFLPIKTKQSRQVHLERPLAIAMLALLCSLARTQCNIRSFRPASNNINAFRIVARGPRGSVRIDLAGNLPTFFTIRSRLGITPCDELVHDIGDVLEDFDLVLAGEM